MISQEGFWFGSDANMVKLGFCTQRSTFDQFCSKKLNQSISYQRLSDKTEKFMKTHKKKPAHFSPSLKLAK